MNILIVKLSSLGDVVHTLPALMDVRQAYPQARIDWVVERAFAPLIEASEAADRVIACELRRWRKRPFAAQTRHAWRDFRDELQAQSYDCIIDLQGLTKSALVSWLARLSPSGQRVAMAHRTDGSSYERPTRWVADRLIALDPHVHAMTRARELCAQALHYPVPASVNPGLDILRAAARKQPCVALIHGTSRDDKLWPLAHWIELGRRLATQGYSVALPHGNEAELLRSQALAEALPGAVVWPRLGIDALAAKLATCAGAVGVDSGLSHIAVALNLPHVQIYNVDTAWRTGPQGAAHQCSVYAQPTPSVDAVWQAWSACMDGAWA